MIRIDGFSEVFGSKSDIAKGYLDVNPAEIMTDQDMANYISKEFDEAHNVVEFDTYEKLMSEVFDLSEDEIDIDFTPDEKLITLLEHFKPDMWESMDEIERKDAVNVLATAIGEALELDSMPDIIIEEGDDSYGLYDYKNNIIVLNSGYFSEPMELVNTIAHELRHAYQHMRADLLETRNDALYKVNFDNYISPVPIPGGGWLFFMDYYDQYVEVDARAFSHKFMEAMA